jgi:hypothetical protein
MYRILLHRKRGSLSNDYSIVVKRRNKLILDKIGFIYNFKIESKSHNMFVALNIRKFKFWIAKGINLNQSNSFCLNSFFYFYEKKDNNKNKEKFKQINYIKLNYLYKLPIKIKLRLRNL